MNDTVRTACITIILTCGGCIAPSPPTSNTDYGLKLILLKGVLNFLINLLADQ